MEDGKKAFFAAFRSSFDSSAEPSDSGNSPEFIVLIGVAAFLGGATRRDEEPSQIPVRGALPAAQTVPRPEQ